MDKDASDTRDACETIDHRVDWEMLPVYPFDFCATGLPVGDHGTDHDGNIPGDDWLPA